VLHVWLDCFVCFPGDQTIWKTKQRDRRDSEREREKEREKKPEQDCELDFNLSFFLSSFAFMCQACSQGNIRHREIMMQLGATLEERCFLFFIFPLLLCNGIVGVFFSPQFSHVALNVGNQSQEDLAKSGYKTN